MRLFCLLFTFAFFCFDVTFTQTIVSTSPTNRNAVLEEFTGIYCGWCPDGHKIANELAAKYENRFFPINIHADYYAIPQQSRDKDMRTDAGETIDSMAGAEAYPTGSINRNTKPWAQSRNYWEDNVKKLIGEASPVNLAIEADVNLSTRELNVLVEYYYTSTEANPTNHLSVMLLQNEIISYQANAEKLNPDFVTEDGLYRHQHCLRMPLTESVWGDEIANTTGGTFGKREYKLVLPETIRDIELDLTQLEVVAFIAPDKANIITAAGTRVGIPAENMVMLSLQDLTVMPKGYFFDTFNPKVVITNEFETEVTQFDLKVTANQYDYSKTFKGNLKKGESVTMDFGDIYCEFTGNYYIKISGFDNINNSKETGQLIVDLDQFDNYSTHEGIHFHRAAFDKTTFTFEEGTEHFALDIDKNTRYLVSHATYPIGVNNSKDAVLYHLHTNYEIEGKPATLLFGEANLKILDDAKIKYFYAYSNGNFGKTDPEIVFYASEDDGHTWIEIDRKIPIDTETGSSSGTYVPRSSDYKKDSVDLKSLFGKNVLIKISVIPGSGGNALWLDNIEIDGTYKNISKISTNLAELDFQSVVVGNTLEKEIQISNKGDSDLEIYSLYIVADDSGVFEVDDLPNPIIPIGETANVKVKFTPVSADLFLSELRIRSNDPENSIVYVSLSGEGEGTSVLSDDILKLSQLKPNPVLNSCNVEFEYTGNAGSFCSLLLVNSSGQIVKLFDDFSINSGKNSFSFNVEDVSPGKYVLIIKDNNLILEQMPLVIVR